jgi:ACS family allantoate permease-like MFS transporter
MYQLVDALTDPIAWAFTFYALTADIPNGGISNFFSQLVSILLIHNIAMPD